MALVEARVDRVEVEVLLIVVSVYQLKIGDRVWNIGDGLLEAEFHTTEVFLQDGLERRHIGGLGDVAVCSETIFDVRVLFMLQRKIKVQFLAVRKYR